MCGIIGYSGDRNAADVLFECLRRLEYRGYDSAGISIYGSELYLCKDKGTIAHLEDVAARVPGGVGIGHTRWATCGRPTKNNAHPFMDCHRRVALAHNGIVENHIRLRMELMKRGHVFTSETDTEVIVHLVEENYKGNAMKSIQDALTRIEGSYALVVLFEGGEIVAVRKDNPLILGLGKNEVFIASDVPGILPYTNRVVFLEEGDMVHLVGGKAEVFSSSGRKRKVRVETVPWSLKDAEKGGYEHFMLKEIYEQPDAIRGSLMGRGDLMDEPWHLRRFDSIRIIACGTSYHAALAGRSIIEERLRIPVIPDIASEYRYSTDLDERYLAILISQSGETADTVAAARKATMAGMETVAICNVLGSSLTREVNRVIYTRAGPEICVAATKTFTSQIVSLHLLSLKLGLMLNTLSREDVRRVLNDLRALPRLAELVLAQSKDIEALAEIIKDAHGVFFMGRGPAYPVALEGALKLKEISYIHAEGYAGGELKHGPLALISEETPVVAVLFNDRTHAKMLGNVDEVVARGAPMVTVCVEGDRDAERRADHLIRLPEPPEPIYSQVPASIALQMLAYHCARLRSCPIDQPRNLAKSVTVE